MYRCRAGAAGKTFSNQTGDNGDDNGDNDDNDTACLGVEPVLQEKHFSENDENGDAIDDECY